MCVGGGRNGAEDTTSRDQVERDGLVADFLNDVGCEAASAERGDEEVVIGGIPVALRPYKALGTEIVEE